ncbi:hypothetical protein [Nonomuraea sediminis]|uniref:hypothetical protein n=1 Tax=Nonomuraea sediminis TaxID=2835864 RepID=UPI001BDBC3FE|nr:hypothetical protein [Nonomuraea sediminis]
MGAADGAECGGDGAILPGQAELGPGQPAGHQVLRPDGSGVEYPYVADPGGCEQGYHLCPYPACPVDPDPGPSPERQHSEPARRSVGGQVEGVQVGLEAIALGQWQGGERAEGSGRVVHHAASRQLLEEASCGGLVKTRRGGVAQDLRELASAVEPVDPAPGGGREVGQHDRATRVHAEL